MSGSDRWIHILSSLKTLNFDPFCHPPTGGKCCLLGDAIHSVKPFFGSSHDWHGGLVRDWLLTTSRNFVNR